MDSSFYTILGLKLSLIPALILAASYAGVRWGPAVSGWLVSLPLTSGPVLFFLAIEQGEAFASQASNGVLLGLASIAAFSFVYTWLATRRPRATWFYPLLAGWGAFFLATFLLEEISVTVEVSFIGVIAFLALVAKVLPRPGVVPPSNTSWKSWEVVIRVVAATALVLFITEASTLLGPYLSGLLTPFPIYVSVLSGSLYRVQGSAAAIQLIRGTTLGLFTPAIFALIIGVTIVGFGIGVAFGIAIVASLPIHTAILRFLR